MKVLLIIIGMAVTKRELELSKIKSNYFCLGKISRIRKESPLCLEKKKFFLGVNIQSCR